MTPERRAEAIRVFLPFLEIEEAHDPVLSQIIRRAVVDEQSLEEIADALQLPVEDADARLQHWARELATMLTEVKIRRSHQNERPT